MHCRGVNQTQQERLTEASRMQRLYEAFRAPEPDSSATRGVFRKAADLLVLFTRLQWEPSGEPRIPGGLEAWKRIMLQKTDSAFVRETGKRAHTWSHPEQLLEAMTSFSSPADGPRPACKCILCSANWTAAARRTCVSQRRQQPSWQQSSLNSAAGTWSSQSFPI